MDKPVILLVFANDRGDGSRYLRNLPEEKRRLKVALHSAEDAKLCEVVVCENATRDEVVNILEDPRYQNRVAIFHFGGHSGSDRLFLESIEGRPEGIHAGGLAELLRMQRGLQLVFLNGCGNELQVKGLQNAGVSAVVATSGAIDDGVATDFAGRFYKAFGSGISSYRRAFDQAAVDLAIAKGGNRRAFFRDDVEVWEDVPWQLHVNPPAKRVADITLAELAGDPLFGLPPPPEKNLPQCPFLEPLAGFTAENAELFFGRGCEIRTLYDRVTSPSGESIILLCGQSGVGKSSLLDAGLIPRLRAGGVEARYERRDRQGGVLRSLRKALQVGDEEQDLREAWQRHESGGTPLVVIVDQVEEAFTRPGANWTVELNEFATALAEIFREAVNRPQGKLILGFRKEWLAEIDLQLEDAKLPRVAERLERLDRRGIIEAVRGAGRLFSPRGDKIDHPILSERLFGSYQLEVEAGLGEEIATYLLLDQETPVAPTLQILLTRMWGNAKKQDPVRPQFTRQLFAQLKNQGIYLQDFLNKQMKQLEGLELQLISSLNDVTDLPTNGRNLVIVATVNNALHFRLFEADGRQFQDINETRRTDQARQIEELRKQLQSLWPPRELSRSEKEQIIAAVISIVGYHELGESFPDEVRSGLALDLLTFHTTSRATAEERSEDELSREYKDRTGVLRPLLERCKELYLLVDPPTPGGANRVTRLAHDTLAPLVREQFDRSDKPGQRARRILENRGREWEDEKTGAPLDEVDLAVVENGLLGMRMPTHAEERLLAESRNEQRLRIQARAKRATNRKILMWTGVGMGMVFLVLAALASWQWYEASNARNQLEVKNQELEVNKHKLEDELRTSNRLRGRNYLTLAIESERTGSTEQALAWSAAALPLVSADPDERLEVRLRMLNLVRRMPYARQVVYHDGNVGVPLYTLDRKKVAVIVEKDVIIRDVVSANELARLRHPALLRLALLRPTGEIVTQDEKEVVRLWDSDKPDQELDRWQPAGGNTVNLLVDQVGGGVLAIQMLGSEESQVSCWYPKTKKPRTSFLAPGRFQSAAISPVEAVLAVASGDRVRVWDLKTGKQLAAGTPAKPVEWLHPGVTSLAFSGNGRLLASGGTDKRAQVGDIHTGRLEWRSPDQFLETPIGTRFSAGNELLAIAFQSGTVLYKTSGWRPSPADNPVPEYLTLGTDQIAPDFRTRVSAVGRAFRIDDLAGGTTPVVSLINNRPVKVFILASGGKYAITLDDWHRAKLWNLATGRALWYCDGVHCAAFDPSGTKFALGGFGTLTCHDLDGIELYCANTGEQVDSLSWSGDGRLLAVATYTTRLDIHDVTAGQIARTLCHKGRVLFAEFSPRGERLLVREFREENGKKSAHQVLWNTATGEVVKRIPGVVPVQQIGDLLDLAAADSQVVPTHQSSAFSADGTRFCGIEFGAAANAVIWSSQSGDEIARLPRAGATGLALDPSGTRLVGYGLNGSGWVWDVNTNGLTTTSGHEVSQILHTAISPDGRLVATCGADRLVTVGFARRSETLTTLPVQPAGVTRCAFASDGQRLALLSKGSFEVRVYDVGDDSTWEDAALISLAEAMSGYSVRNGGLETLSAATGTAAWEGVRDSYAKRFGTRPTSVAAYLWRESRHAVQVQDWTASANYLSALIELHQDVDIPRVRAERGTALVILGKFAEAEKDFQAAFAAYPDNASYRESLGYAIHSQGRLKDASRVYASTPPLGIDQAIPLLNRANLYAELATDGDQAQWANAERYLEGVLAELRTKSPTAGGAVGTVHESECWRFLAVTLLSQGKTAEFDKLRNRLLERLPPTSLTRLTREEARRVSATLARVCILTPVTGRDTETYARDALSDFAASSRGDSPEGTTAAAVLFRLGGPALAEQEINAVWRQTPADALTARDWAVRAMVLRSRGKPIDAVEALRKARETLDASRAKRKKGGANRPAWQEVAEGELWIRAAEEELARTVPGISLTLGALDDAPEVLRERITQLEARVKTNAKDADAWLRLGIARSQLGGVISKEADWKRAAADFAEAVRLKPDDRTAYYLRALGVLLAGQPDEYRKICETAFEKFGKDEKLQSRQFLLRLGALAPNSTMTTKKVTELLGTSPWQGDSFVSVAAVVRSAATLPNYPTKGKEFDRFLIQAEGRNYGVGQRIDIRPMLYLVISKGAQKDEVEARVWFEKAEGEIARMRSGTLQVDWVRRLETEILYLEAQAIVKPPPK